MRQLVATAWLLYFICLVLYYAALFIRLIAENRFLEGIQVDEKDFRLFIGSIVFCLEVEFQSRPPSSLDSVVKLKACANSLLYSGILITTVYEHFEDVFLLAALSIGAMTNFCSVYYLIQKPERSQGPEEPAGAGAD
ncbi:uncharacterized protein LOC133526194 [Cydia pomonella]|uniref:uncharacterized protein LOC133526194 n=1 Tax=Cydia pomonella TaxID=82600 RepID=UPI002ADE3923|nr:uncharacterized protein LOC133526194 [Cydia pomonella]